MITNAKNYSKKKKKETNRENPRTNGKSKPIQTKSHKEAHIYTQKEKKEKNIYIYKINRATKSINNSTNDNKL